MLNRVQLLADLEADEGLKTLLYDDATDAPITKGSTLGGWPTLGIGWNVATTPLTPDQYRTILGWMVDAKTAPLAAALPWMANLTEPRQRALTNMAYQLGVHGLQAFGTFLGLMENGRYGLAADDLSTTEWFRQSGDRAIRIQGLIQKG